MRLGQPPRVTGVAKYYFSGHPARHNKAAFRFPPVWGRHDESPVKCCKAKAAFVIFPCLATPN